MFDPNSQYYQSHRRALAATGQGDVSFEDFINQQQQTTSDLNASKAGGLDWEVRPDGSIGTKNKQAYQQLVARGIQKTDDPLVNEMIQRTQKVSGMNLLNSHLGLL